MRNSRVQATRPDLGGGGNGRMHLATSHLAPEGQMKRASLRPLSTVEALGSRAEQRLDPWCCPTVQQRDCHASSVDIGLLPCLDALERAVSTQREPTCCKSANPEKSPRPQRSRFLAPLRDRGFGEFPRVFRCEYFGVQLGKSSRQGPQVTW